MTESSSECPASAMRKQETMRRCGSSARVRWARSATWWVDALYEKVRVDDPVESMAVVIATGVNLEGRRECWGWT